MPIDLIAQLEGICNRFLIVFALNYGRKPPGPPTTKSKAKISHKKSLNIRYDMRISVIRFLRCVINGQFCFLYEI